MRFARSNKEKKVPNEVSIISALTTKFLVLKSYFINIKLRWLLRSVLSNFYLGTLSNSVVWRSCSWVMSVNEISKSFNTSDNIPSRYEWLSFMSFSSSENEKKKAFRDWWQTLLIDSSEGEQLLFHPKSLSNITHEYHLVLSLSLISIKESQTSASTREKESKEDFPAELSNYSLVLFLNFEQLLIWRLSLSSYCINLSCKPFICFVFLCWSLWAVRREALRAGITAQSSICIILEFISPTPTAHAVMKLDVEARSVQLRMNERKKNIPKPSKSTCTFLSHHDFKYFQNTSS